MSVSVAVSVTPSLALTRTDTGATGETDTLEVVRPSNSRGTAAAAVTLTCTKAGSIASFSLAASTPVDLNLSTILTAISAWKGDTSFSDVKLIDVTNNEAPGSGRKLTMFGKGTTAAFLGPVPNNTSQITIDPGCRRQFYTRESAGWTVGTANIIRLDPGTNPVNISLSTAGD